MIDKNTFGDSPAAIDLAEIINENGYKCDKISRILNEFSEILIETNNIPTDTSINMIAIIYSHYKNKCDEISDEKLRSFTKNVLSTNYKGWQFRKNVSKPSKNRK